MTNRPGVETAGPISSYWRNNWRNRRGHHGRIEQAIGMACLLLWLGGGCGLAVTRPKLEMSFAVAALTAARKANAQKWTPHLYRKAEYYYLKAKSAYRRKYFNKARQYAKLAASFSEKAEFVSVIKKTEGEL